MRSFCLVLMAVALAAADAGAAQPAGNSTAKRISNHIQQSGQLQNYRIGVTYKDGVATLAGTVSCPEQRDAAIALTKEVQGVKRVQCKLQYTDQADGIAANAGEPGELSEYQGPSENFTAPGQPGRTAPTAAEAQLARFNGQQSGVMQAYGNGGAGYQAAPQRMPNSAAGQMPRPQMARRNNMPLPTPRHAMDPSIRQASMQGCAPAGPYMDGGMAGGMGPGAMPAGVVPTGFGHGGHAPAYENPNMPGYAWPSYAAYPNYAAVSYPQQYSPTAWPYIGPFYPYPQVPLAWRKVALEWDDGWWFLDFSAHNSSH